jgi:putative selenate reductase
MYMSGRALYPITLNLFHKLAQEFDSSTGSEQGPAGSGQGLEVSYSAGADALNVTALLAAGARPVTAASDLLKPGGYSRFLQYLENLGREMRERGVTNLDELARDRLDNLARAAAEALQDPRYKKHYFSHGLPKVESGLDLFDCVVAPCMAQCAVCQDVPEYAWLVAQGEYDRALEVILARNPLPAVTGYVCTALCQTRCVRNDYDEPVAIRVLKRVAAEKGRVTMRAGKKSDRKVAVIGAGPSGLAAASFLALNGVQVTIFEAQDKVGGMLRLVPVFRLPWAIVQEDVDRITAMGVEIRLSHPITRPPEELLKEGFDAVYVASGFQKDAPLYVPGMQGQGVLAALDLLARARRGQAVDLGAKALVIGGGDTAMDATRVAQRYTGNPVTVVYRRTRREMPAIEEEREGTFEEGNLLEELASPTRVIRRDGRVVALECVRNRLGEPGPDGRRRPVPIAGSEFQIEADSIIVAVGQSPDLTFLDGSAVSLHENGSIAVHPHTGLAGTPGVYAGGDVVEGPESIIAACADGRRAAEAMCAEFGIPFEQLPCHPAELSEEEILGVKRARARKEAQIKPDMLPPAQRRGFELIEATLSEEAARSEGLRCLQCTIFCDKCVEVCPNRANFTYTVSPLSLTLPQLACQNGALAVVGQEPFRVQQTRQILNLDDFCNECGNCVAFCVHQGKPHAEKPKLFLREADFELEDDNAFYVEVGGDAIRRRKGGQTSQLALKDGSMTFEDAQVRVSLSPDFEIKEMVLKDAFEGTFSLQGAAEMALILRGVTTSLSFMLGGVG